MAKAAKNTADPLLWNGPSLLVPVDVEALVVSKLSLNYPWAYNRMKYNNAGKFENVRPSMFQDADRPGVGVTLHWALPDGITHGRQEGEQIRYPYAPNRWLIIRYYEGKSKSWILQSDYLDPKDGANLFLKPDAATPTVTRIGKVWPAAQWPGEAAVSQQQFLMALGPGNPAFAAYTANINNVFSFYDDMSDIVDKAVPVTYTVMGWYGNAADDPLNNFTTLDEWLGLMDSLLWTVGDNNDLQKAVNDWMAWAKANNITVNPDQARDLYPSRTLCQGMVYKVNWLGQNGVPQSGVPQYDPSMPAEKQPRIAVANTAIDALAALVAFELDLEGQDGEAAAELLEAFNYNLLTKYQEQGGQYQLYREIFKAWFGNHDAEYYYYIDDKDKPEDPFIKPERLADLVSLNRKAAERDLNLHLMQSAQSDLYGNWWKTGKSGTYWGKPPAGISAAEWKVIQDNLKNAIPGNKQLVSDLQEANRKLDTEIAALIEKVKEGLPSTQELKENMGNRYHQANDPVVLIYGAHRAYRHGEDGRFDDDDHLFTRFTGQTITGLQVMLPNQPLQPVMSDNVTLPPVSLPASGLVPKETNSICIDNYFFDTLNAPAIAQAACTLLKIPYDAAYANNVAAQQTAAWNADIYNIDRQLVTDASGFIGTIPSKVAVQLWAAPWAPLYMAWEINWFPSYDEPSKALEKWQFDAEALEYVWDERYNVTGSSVTISGSSLITPNSAFVMQAQLEKYFEDTGKFPDLREFLNTVSQWDFLTQSMSGLNELLLALNPDQLNQAPADVNSLVGDMTQLSPVPDMSVKNYPVRAGHFQLNKLWVVDDFGQVFDPISAVGQQPAGYNPVVGTGMVTPNNPNLVQLPPRVTQNARFEFNFLSGDGKTNDSGQINQMTDPICGWLLPNHLDKGLSLYTPDGHLLGELILTGTFSQMQLRWDNAPGKNVPVGAPLEEVIPNPYLRSFVANLLAREDSAAAFSSLLSIIDETLWTVEPLGGRNNELISVFIGRPLALVRSAMNYNLMGAPVYSQNWKDSTLKVTGGYEDVVFPVQTGCLQDPQDGTIGYFLEDFLTFNSILAGKIDKASGYITNEPVALSFKEPAKEVFLLVDPRGDVNVIPGILPVQLNVLPGTLVENAMSNMNVTFRTGPLITDPDQLSMPLPSEMSGKWSWIQHTGVTTWEELTTIAQANEKARIGVGYELKDGWLKLSNALNDSK